MAQTRKKTKKATTTNTVGQESPDHDNVQPLERRSSRGLNKAYSDLFDNIKKLREADAFGAIKTISRQKKVRFHQPLVTSVRRRPTTKVEEKPILYFSPDELQRNRSEEKLETKQKQSIMTIIQAQRKYLQKYQGRQGLFESRS
eukprot:CAMPEP_0203703572 /NCGR_PEP_ID=MMETSP0091-20130426/43665_1 /ASSEMBLY_ACC=CAM_ASM_001089 /TAXON_ID=426623 /ORGANISM="Chaetoceros affinis, Strain CCMP159" /LENGTH=143 /DNA_ID=CAMNT_0050578273 /DNA_START=45 /DNA_END=473 /DNA_ORIENTATION=+